jgi:hypothetical protein
MVLRFEVDQAEAFRLGVNVPKSTNHLEVDPSKLTQEDRNLIADRLDGIDVCELSEGGGMMQEPNPQADGRRAVPNTIPMRITAKLPTLESLMEAIRENEKAVQQKG